MKKRPIQVLAIIVVIAVAIWVGLILLAREKGKPTVKPNEQGPVRQSQTTSTATPAASSAPRPDLSIYKTDPKWIWWNEQNARDPSFEWKMPINFYGKVVDEDCNPVGGATAKCIWTDLSSKGTSTAEVTSDARGLFSLTGKTGKFLEVRVRKNGYYSYLSNRFSFEYAAFFESNYHQPDANNPVVFRLRKQGEIPKELVARETMMGIAPTGQPHYIDLRTTRKSSEAQAAIAVRITRTAPKEQKRYDWSASIEGVNGAGLIESEDEFMFEAPQDGYKPAYSYRFAEGSPDWENKLKRKYYVTAEGGQVYGRLEVEFFPKYQNAAAIAVRFIVNPTGTRNLEYQPNKVLPR